MTLQMEVFWKLLNTTKVNIFISKILPNKHFLIDIIWLMISILIFQLLNEPRLGTGIDPCMALTPFPSSIG